MTGLDNFKRLVENDKIRGPFVRVFIWTFAHAFFTVFLTFWFGLFMALLLNAKFTPGRAVLRTLLLVPYSLPAFISVLVWKGLLNEQLGVVNKATHRYPGHRQRAKVDLQPNVGQGRYPADPALARFPVHDADLHGGAAIDSRRHLRSGARGRRECATSSSAT